MTTQDYVKIAEVLRETRPKGADTMRERQIQWEEVVNAMADMLGKDNPRFRRVKFLVATMPKLTLDCECDDKGKGQYHLPGCSLHVS